VSITNLERRARGGDLVRLFGAFGTEALRVGDGLLLGGGRARGAISQRLQCG
jgi:hypothetical protein